MIIEVENQKTEIGKHILRIEANIISYEETKDYSREKNNIIMIAATRHKKSRK